MTIKELNINYFRVINDPVTQEIIFKLYDNNSRKWRKSFQSKPYLGRDSFINLCWNPGIFKIVFLLRGQIHGILLITDNLQLYPDGHYSKDFFSIEHRDINFSDKRILYVIGNGTGIAFSEELQSSLRSLDDISHIYENTLNILRNELEGNFVIFNSSRCVEGILLNDFSVVSMRHIRSSYDIKELDRETFVHIQWDQRKKQSIKTDFVLATAGRFISYAINDKIYVCRSFVINKYYIRHFEKMDARYSNELADIYRERLMNVNEHSPQLLEYDRSIFINYLADEKIDKYILFNKRNNIVGAFLLIRSNNSDCVAWMTSENRIADLYIKIIFTKKGVPSYLYLLLFLVSIRHIIGRLTNHRSGSSLILADWSECINGLRFRTVFNIKGKAIEGLKKSSRRRFTFPVLISRIIMRFIGLRAKIEDEDIYEVLNL